MRVIAVSEFAQRYRRAGEELHIKRTHERKGARRPGKHQGKPLGAKGGGLSQFGSGATGLALSESGFQEGKSSEPMRSRMALTWQTVAKIVFTFKAKRYPESLPKYHSRKYTKPLAPRGTTTGTTYMFASTLDAGSRASSATAAVTSGRRCFSQPRASAAQVRAPCDPQKFDLRPDFPTSRPSVGLGRPSRRTDTGRTCCSRY